MTTLVVCIGIAACGPAFCLGWRISERWLT